MNVETARISDLAQIRAGYQTRKGLQERTDGSHTLLQIRDFNNERTAVDIAGMARISPSAVSQELVLREGDVVFLAKGAKSFGFAVADLPEPSLAASCFFIVRPSRRVDPAYLAWYLNLESTRRTIARQVGQGTRIPVVRRQLLEDLEVPLPSLQSQRLIAAVAELADQQQRLLAQLAERKHLLVTAACVRAAHYPFTHEDHP